MRNGASLLLLTLVLSTCCCRSPALAHVGVNDAKAAQRVRERNKKRRQRARAKEAAAEAAARAAAERAAADDELHALRAQAQAHRAQAPAESSRRRKIAGVAIPGAYHLGYKIPCGSKRDVFYPAIITNHGCW